MSHIVKIYGAIRVRPVFYMILNKKRILLDNNKVAIFKNELRLTYKIMFD